MFATFDRLQIEMTSAQAKSASHQGDCEADVQALLRNPKIASQFEKIDPEAIRAELREYGAWDADELADDERNRARILWIAAGNVLERRPGI